MFCKKCGKYVQPTEKQCPYCGEIMEDTVNNQADNGTGNASEDVEKLRFLMTQKKILEKLKSLEIWILMMTMLKKYQQYQMTSTE